MRMSEAEFAAAQAKTRISVIEEKQTVKPTSMQRLQALGRKKPGEMNKTEAAYAERLDAMLQAGEIQWYAFEAITLKLAPDCRLTVDFFIMDKDGFLQAHDVKGSKAIVTDDFKVKVKVAADKFPFQFFCAYPIAKKNGGGWEVEAVK